MRGDNFTRIFLLKLINFYQKEIRPFYPPVCKYYPSCSEYSLQVLKKFSLPKALRKILWRILRCNPFSPGGYDPVESLDEC